jgi:hypothetical protein
VKASKNNKQPSEQKRLEIVNAIAQGFSLTKSLGMSGSYSPSTIGHASVAIISTKPYRDCMRKWAEAIAEKTGEQSIASELELIRVGKAHFREVRIALQKIWQAYNGKERKALMGNGHAALKQEIFEKYLSPAAQRQKQELLERAKAIQPGQLGQMAKARLEDDLINPGKDFRARNTSIRLGLEADGYIGSNPAAVHLHQHQHNERINFNALSPATQQLMFSKMIEVQRRQTPEKTWEETRADLEMQFVAEGWTVPPIDATVIERPAAIQEDWPRLTAPVKVLEQPAPPPASESPKQDDEALLDMAIRRLQIALPNLRRAEVEKHALRIVSDVRGKLQ